MTRLWILLAGGSICCSCFWAVPATGAPEARTTAKIADSFDQDPWVNSPWNSGVGKTLISSDAAQGTASKRSMELQARYSGHGFEAVTILPPAPLVIPGETKSVTLRVKRADKRYGLKMTFTDGWGREKTEGNQALAWDIRLADTNGWQTCVFTVPSTWIQPIAVSGLATHNWEAQSAANTVSFWLDELEVATDLSQVDLATGVLKSWRADPDPADPAKARKEAPKSPLTSLRFSTGAECNVFAGEEPRVSLHLRNWKPQTLSGEAEYEVLNESGQAVTNRTLPVSVESTAGYELALGAERFGRYTVKASVSLSDGTRRRQEIVLAKLPPLKPLSDAQKMASPYGLNIHSGEKVVIAPFRKAGLVWFREYAFQWDWVLRAKGADRRYAGWPYYNKIVQAHLDEGVKILPVVQQSLKPPEVKEGKVTGLGPDEAWTREMASLMLSFPEVTHWELSNEYDLPEAHRKAEDLCGWGNYRAYHRQFAEVLSIVGGASKVAVENGRAGIWPKRERDCVASGDFARIGVINSHHYCGSEAPESNFENFNMGFDASEQQLGCFYDVLRAVKEAAQADGKKRESWLTEFGWDTLAGPVVTPYEQAVFLPRAWMLAMAAGTDKAFWFYNFDAAHPKTFFDGCGLLAANGEPKLSLCALAGMTSVLPAPRFAGTLNAGENTWGYVFENGGKLVASLWAVHGSNGPVVQFHAEKLVDYLGNTLSGNSARLTMAPVYAVGLEKTDLWYRQTAYSLKTPLLIGATGGDTVRAIVTVDNHRTEPIECEASLFLPEGWTNVSGAKSSLVKPGESADLDFSFRPGLLESQGIKDAKIVVSEGRKIKDLPFRIMIQPALTMQAGPIVGCPGPASATVKVTNLSARPQDATLRIKVPDSWQVPASAIPVRALKPKEQRTIQIDVTWSTSWKAHERAFLELDAGLGEPLVQPLIPNEYRLYQAGNIKLDGDLSEWPAASELPNWMLGCTSGGSRARIFLGWAAEGLYGAVEASDSRAVAGDPRSFWTCDALELFVDTRNLKQPRAYESGDHQFWLAPLTAQNRVYVGQWKRGGELGQTQFDLQGIQSAARKTDDGYVMEFLLPAAMIRQYQPARGARVGLNLNLSVRGRQSDREVFWPAVKSSGAPDHPEAWGALQLSASP